MKTQPTLGVFDSDSVTPSRVELSQRLVRANIALRELVASASSPLLQAELDKLNRDLETIDILLSESSVAEETLASANRLLGLSERLLTILRVPQSDLS